MKDANEIFEQSQEAAKNIMSILEMTTDTPAEAMTAVSLVVAYFLTTHRRDGISFDDALENFSQSIKQFDIEALEKKRKNARKAI